MDIRIPKIRIRTKISLKNLQRKRIVVEVDHWEVESVYPNGHFVRVLGEVGDLETEITCLLMEHDVNLDPFSANALSCLPPNITSGSEWTIPLEEIQSRKDLRYECRIFSVDPPGCQDIDDTMHARSLPNGDIEVGVHIADVSYFVQHHSALDNEAMKRGTTFYLVDRRFDMLPSILSSDLCSLHGQVDRLAVSVIWVLSSDLKTVKSAWFGRTVIHNVAAMTYQQAHNILHNKPPDDPNHPPPPPFTAGSPVDTELIPSLKKDLTILTKLARILRKNREEIGGAVDLSSGDRGSELKFTLDENGLPTRVVAKTEMEIHHTIAELMIMANGYVASKIHEHYPSSSLLRIHQSVEQNRFEDLESAFKAGGVSFDGRSNMALAESLRQAKASGKDAAAIDALFQSLATRAMSEAQYICTGSKEAAAAGLSHYGLGIEKYTHFTSPIRRYADVVVHRLLLAAVTKKEDGIRATTSLDVGVNRNGLEDIPDSAAMSVLAGDGLEGSEQKQQSDDLEGDELLDFLLEETSELKLGEDDTDSSDLDHGKSNETKDANDKLTNAEDGPYGSSEVVKICERINHQNRISKLCSMACQRLFLSLYFRGHIDSASAVIIGLRTNGLLVYVPKYDMKGPVFLSDKDGNVQVHPSVMGLPPKTGLPPTSGFAIIDGCKKFPDGKCDIYNADDEGKKYLQLTVPSGSSSFHCDFRLLDVVEVQLSCDTSDTIARIPPTRLHLISKGKKPKIGVSNETKVTTKLVEQRQKETSKSNDNCLAAMNGAKDVDNTANVYHIFSSIEILPNLDDTPLRFSLQHRTKKLQKQRVQTIPGRLVFGGFRNSDTHKASQEAAANAAVEAAAQRRNIAVQNQAIGREYDEVRRIEKDVTSRMQRLAAEKRHTRRAKAGK